MSRLTEIRKAIEELAPEERENFATDLTDMILLRNVSGLRLLKSEDVKSSLEKWFLLTANRY